MSSIDKPGPPAAFDITEVTNESCLLTWNPPRDDGGSKITNYVVERKATDSDMWHKLSSTVKDTNFKATKLTPNKEYLFRVAAENMYGVGEPVQAAPITAKFQFGKFLNQLGGRRDGVRMLVSNLDLGVILNIGHVTHIIILSIDPPGPPTRLEPSDITKDAVTLTWCEPDDDGGSPITGYWVERLDPDTDKWVKCNKMPIKDTTYRYAHNLYQDVKTVIVHTNVYSLVFLLIIHGYILL